MTENEQIISNTYLFTSHTEIKKGSRLVLSFFNNMYKTIIPWKIMIKYFFLH